MKTKFLALCLVVVALLSGISCSAADYYTDADIDTVAKLIWGEARGVGSLTEMSGVAWVVCNRVDKHYADGTIYGVVTAKGQFAGYSRKNPIDPTCRSVAKDVLERWESEKNGCIKSYRTLPSDYCYFSGNGKHNRFRKTYKSQTFWNWSLDTPYVN